jgi:threonine aldolase
VTGPIIDLRSDTLTQPTEEMLRSIQSAKLGDDSRDGDPTVLELEGLAARMLGKEAALLTVSGTMSNLVAMRTHTEPGGAVIAEQNAHLYGLEFGGLAAACGLLVLPVPSRLGAMIPAELTLAARRSFTGFPSPALVCLENTHNTAGGTVISPEHMDLCCGIAHGQRVPVHLDGARLFNAAVKLNVDASALTRSVDSVSICLSKGLSAPVGSLLAGTRPFVERARKIRRAFGGTMRQAGIIAAPGLVALRTMAARLAEDHENARIFASCVHAVPGLTIDMESVQTNIVNVDVKGLGIDAVTFIRHLEEKGVRALAGMGTVVRFVTYRGITRADVEQAVLVIGRVVERVPWHS